ncbi:MAG: hypothetical protein RI958_207 [Actinomycetota bacterium]|jgi:multiple sugar transport system substrate-binding protein
MSVRVALVGGPMYDHLYDMVQGRDIEVVVHADHPSLNSAVAAMLAAGERIDLISTHSKYVPSQMQWLRPLDDLIDISGLAPLAVDLCRFEGAQWSVPRLIDVRIAWVRRRHASTTIDTWDQVVGSELVAGFPGRESGLFGTFFELVVGAGGRLFADDGSPHIESPEAVAAVETLVALARRAPANLPDWHYDELDRALLDGTVDMAGAWPGAWGAIRPLAEAGELVPVRYPAGERRWVSYAGCHAWAVPATCGDLAGALELLRVLTSSEANRLDATGGNVCAHVEAFADIGPTSDVDRRRLAVTAATIEGAMITYPPHPRFPDLESAGWRAIRSALIGECSPSGAVEQIQRVAEHVIGPAT